MFSYIFGEESCRLLILIFCLTVIAKLHSVFINQCLVANGFRFKDIPVNETGSFPIAENEKERVMHCSIRIGQMILMGADTSESCGQMALFGDNITINICPDNEAEARKIFNALANGGKIIMPIEKTFWADLFGMCIDKFGVSWMINYEHEKKY